MAELPQHAKSSTGPAATSVDLRSLKPTEARARAFSGMFKIRPGQRVNVLVNSPDVEREIMKWVDEIGHRFLRRSRIEDNGASHFAIELIKIEARR
jgi:TusA-related sulfurtransferase